MDLLVFVDPLLITAAIQISDSMQLTTLVIVKIMLRGVVKALAVNVSENTMYLHLIV